MRSASAGPRADSSASTSSTDRDLPEVARASERDSRRSGAARMGSASVSPAGCSPSVRRRRLPRMDAPETRYTKSGDVHVAYQVFGSGGLDLVFLAEFWNSIEAMWEQAGYRHFLERLGSFARVICIDQRGTGSSDPVSLSDMPTLEVWTDDVITTMEAARSKKASVLGIGGGGGGGGFCPGPLAPRARPAGSPSTPP